MKTLIFLLFIVFVSSDVIQKGLINRKFCLGGRIVKGICRCQNKTALFRYECKPCIGGKIIFNRCRCPSTQYLSGNKCIPKPEDEGSESDGISISDIIEGRPGDQPYSGKKPVIYLYPKKNMDISVQLNIKQSKFTTIYPKFNGKNTWNVKAKPNGDILINDKTYPYLFWEVDSYAPYDINEGFIVSGENAEKFLEEKLEILGLNEKEKTDFITYWLPVLLKNKLSLCSFQSKNFLIVLN